MSENNLKELKDMELELIDYLIENYDNELRTNNLESIVDSLITKPFRAKTIKTWQCYEKLTKNSKYCYYEQFRLITLIVILEKTLNVKIDLSSNKSIIKASDYAKEAMEEYKKVLANYL